MGGWTRRAGAPTVGQTPAQASGLRRGAGAEVCVVDRYVGRTVHESVPGCRSHPKSFERNNLGFGLGFEALRRCEPALVVLHELHPDELALGALRPGGA